MPLIPAQFESPERGLSHYAQSQPDRVFHAMLMTSLRNGQADRLALQRALDQTSFPKQALRLILILYAPGHRRIVVSRAFDNADVDFVDVFQRLLAHARRAALADAAFSLQMDFVTQAPRRVDLNQIGMEQAGERHFEIGVDGLLIRTVDGKLHIFAPGDAYVRSVMGMGQLRDYLYRAHGEDVVRTSTFERFRSDSYLTSQDGWRALYRGYPQVGSVTREKIARAVDLAIDHIKLTQKADGKFLYYYDAATNSYRDHEHPQRDPVKNPYYNILRHAGGGMTCLFHERCNRRDDTWRNITRAIDYLVAQARLQDYNGQQGAYIYSEKKSKLGGSGIALYLLAQ